MFFKILNSFSCFAITAEDPNGRTRKTFSRSDKVYVLKRVLHSDGLKVNLVCPDYLLLDVNLSDIYPLTNMR